MQPTSEALKNLGELLSAQQGTTSPATGVAVAEVFGWNETPATAVVAPLNGLVQSSARGLMSGQPAAVFAVVNDARESGALDQAALYAYHAAIPWGLLVDKQGAVIFNSHWLRDDRWFHLPLIPWQDAEQYADLLNGITPEGLTHGKLERAVGPDSPPDAVLMPVDDALVARLDHWRDEALQHTRRVEAVDERLQTLFAQFFVLRTVEDRRLTKTVPPLSTSLTARNELDRSQLKAILAGAKQQVGSELFDSDFSAELPAPILIGIIEDLYRPHHLPGQARYNFGWIDADVLGMAYEKYLSTVLMPSPLPPQIALFDQPLRGVQRVSVRKAVGVYYTPPYLVRYLAESAVERFLSKSPLNGDELPRVADFACGSGSFLVAIVDVLIRLLRGIDPARNWAKALVSGQHIVGIDNDEKAVTMARLNLWQRFTEEPDPLPLPRLSEVIVHGDSLSEEVWAELPQQFDIVLGNPPFLATGKTPPRDELARRFRTAQGRFDYSYLFVELAITRLRIDGVLGMVVPNRLFRNRDAGIIRELLTAECDLLAIVDFGSLEVFEGTSAYIGTITAIRRDDGSPRATAVRVVIVAELSSRFMGALLTSYSRPESKQTDFAALQVFNAFHPRGTSPWVLLSPEAKKLRTQVEDISEPLASVAGIFQGIRTGANDIFIVTLVAGGDAGVVQIENGLGECDVIESGLLHPVVFGSEIQRYDLVSTERRLIYPYRNGQTIGEPELRTEFPRTYAYLNRYREFLIDRSSISQGGLKWYELVRKRDENWLGARKLLIRDLATEPSFALDDLGATYLVGGTAVVPADQSLLLPLLGYLNSKLTHEYLAQITPSFKRGFQKFEPQHLQQIPVLRRVIENEETSARLGDLATNALTAHVKGEESAHAEAVRAIDDFISALLVKPGE
jgi:hypothetical protein